MRNKINIIMAIMIGLMASNDVMATQIDERPCGYFESWHGLFPYFVKCKTDLIIKIPTKETDEKD